MFKCDCPAASGDEQLIHYEGRIIVCTFRPIALRSRQRKRDCRELADSASQHRGDAEMEGSWNG